MTATEPTLHDTPTTSGPPDPSGSTGQARPAALFRTILLVVLALVLVASVVVFAFLLAGRRGAAETEQRSREDVMSQASQFMIRVNTYGPDLLEGTTMPKYRTQVSEVITPKFDTDFEKNVPAAEATVAQGGVARVAKVDSTGVSTIDDDSATALVAGSFTNSYPKEPGSTERVADTPSPFRVQVTLVKIDGDWLVDDFTPLTGLDDQQSGQQVDPSTLPTEQPSDEPAPTGGATP